MGRWARSPVIAAAVTLSGLHAQSAAPTDAEAWLGPGDGRWIEVQLLTRQRGDEPAAITASARARTGPPIQATSPPPGICVEEVTAAVEAGVAGAAFGGAVELRLPAPLRLSWDTAARAFLPVGPQVGPAPSWLVADLRWVAGVERLEAPGAVRLSEAPAPLAADRLPGGGVRLRWRAEGPVEVRTRGLVCGGARDGVDLPWWAVPASGGEVVLRGRRVHRSRVATADGDRLIVGEALMERVVPLDQPIEAAPAPLPRAPARALPAPPRAPARSRHG